MELGILKPLLTALVMPPLFLLLLALLGIRLAWRNKNRGLVLITLSLVMFWLLSCHGVAVWLARHALPQFDPVSVAQLKTGKVQAIAVLGGGVLPVAPEYGEAQPSELTAGRLRYGIWLGRHSGLPIAFSGGVGWAAEGSTSWGAGGSQTVSEAEVAARVALQDYGVKLHWLESQSHDTEGNAHLLAPILQRDGVQRIALVTDAWHMPRAVLAFERYGLQVTPAPTGYVMPIEVGILEWLPSARGLQTSRDILREWLGLAVGRLMQV